MITANLELDTLCYYWMCSIGKTFPQKPADVLGIRKSAKIDRSQTEREQYATEYTLKSAWLLPLCVYDSLDMFPLFLTQELCARDTLHSRPLFLLLCNHCMPFCFSSYSCSFLGLKDEMVTLLNVFKRLLWEFLGNGCKYFTIEFYINIKQCSQWN